MSIITFLNPEGDSPFILTGDHAGMLLPKDFIVGESQADIDEISQSHRLCDLGVQEMLAALSARLNAPAIQANYSRLVLDVNRHFDDPTSIRPISDGKIIPSNYRLSSQIRQARITKYFSPFHEQLAHYIRHRQSQAKPSFVVSLHSFTPQMMGMAKRIEEIALLYHEENGFIPHSLEFLQAKGFHVGDNQPYSSKGGFGYSLALHGKMNHLPAISIEYRQDYLINSEKRINFLELTTELLATLTIEAAIPKCLPFTADIAIECG